MRVKKILASAMAGAMVVGTLAGCGNSGNDSTTAAATTAAATTAAGTTAEGTTAEGTTAASEPGEWEAFAENVQIQIPVYDRGATEFGAVDDNYWTQYIQKEFGDKYNITVKYVSIPRGDVMTKYNQLIATRDNTKIPTIFMEYDYPKLSQWAADGALQEVDYDQFKEVAPSYYARMEKDGLTEYGALNGSTYFCFAERPYYNYGYTYVSFLRMDWLEEVGITEVPQNYEDYCTAVDKLIAAGHTNPIGMSMTQTGYIMTQAFFPEDISDEDLAMNANLSTASFGFEPFYNSLKRSNEEYNKGYDSPEFDLDQSGDEAKAAFVAGKTFSYGGYMSAAGVDWLYNFYENNPDAKLAVTSNFQGVSDDCLGGYRTTNPFGMIIGFSVVATEDQVKAAEMYMEWMSQEENLFVLQNGFEGKTYELDEDGNAQLISDYAGEEKLNQNANKDLWCVAKEARVVGETLEDAIKAVAPVGTPQDEEILAGMLNAAEEQKEQIKAGRAFADPIYGVVIESEAEYGESLKSLFQEAYVKLIKCKPEEFDALYEDYTQQYLDGGYQEILDERKAALDAGQVIVPEVLE